MNVTRLICSKCQASYPPSRLHQLCACGRPLLVQYDLEKAARTLTRESLAHRPQNLWRYREVLPVERTENIITLGEGFTPLLNADRLGRLLGLNHLFIKDESFNPTDSFKARGMAVAVSMARELGLTKLAVPSAGNAGGALAAYAARAGMQACLFMPADVPRANIIEAEVCGARIELVDGVITDCARMLSERREEEGFFDMSTLKEPYRVEGKKTMGYELAEQLDWTLPDVILYPTGGGTGLIGMWKAFDEMEAMGWIGPQRPRMVSVQAAGCAPIVRAFEQNLSEATEVADPQTVASGLRVPRAIGDLLMLGILRKSRGCAIAVTDQALMSAVREIAHLEGLFPAPEGAACLPALRNMIDQNQVRCDDRIVLFNTASGFKYLDLF